MLVLSRKSGEQIVLPECEVTLTVLGVSGSRVRIGIAAPDGTAVHRREVWDKIAASPPEPVREHRLQPCE